MNASNVGTGKRPLTASGSPSDFEQALYALELLRKGNPAAYASLETLLEVLQTGNDPRMIAWKEGAELELNELEQMLRNAGASESTLDVLHDSQVPNPMDVLRLLNRTSQEP